MPDGMKTPEEFELETDNTTKINYLYRLTYESYRKRKWNDFKTISGGFVGGFTAMIAKFIFWK